MGEKFSWSSGGGGTRGESIERLLSCASGRRVMLVLRVGVVISIEKGRLSRSTGRYVVCVGRGSCLVVLRDDVDVMFVTE